MVRCVCALVCTNIRTYYLQCAYFIYRRGIDISSNWTKSMWTTKSYQNKKNIELVSFMQKNSKSYFFTLNRSIFFVFFLAKNLPFYFYQFNSQFYWTWIKNRTKQKKKIAHTKPGHRHTDPYQRKTRRPLIKSIRSNDYIYKSIKLSSLHKFVHHNVKSHPWSQSRGSFHCSFVPWEFDIDVL